MSRGIRVAPYLDERGPMNIIQAKSALSTQQLAVLAIEVNRRRRSKALAYVFLVIFGGVGLHQFYLDRPTNGMCFLAPPAALLIALLSQSQLMLALACLGFVTSGICWIVDLFTLSGQVDRANEAIEGEVIGQIAALTPAERLAS